MCSLKFANVFPVFVLYEHLTADIMGDRQQHRSTFASFLVLCRYTYAITSGENNMYYATDRRRPVDRSDDNRSTLLCNAKQNIHNYDSSIILPVG
uniref:Secreted protein n=1 Tax=Steinernema glaseri TaxID=37863 RepID=A0A1I7YSD6_9BILA